MSEASSMNFSVYVPGKGKTHIGRMVTLERLIEWIKSQEFDEHTTKSLIYLASRYPSHALPLFKKNFNLMLQRARAMRQSDSEENITPTQHEPVVETFSNLDDGLSQSWKGQKNDKEKSIAMGDRKSEEVEGIRNITEENDESVADDWQDEFHGDAYTLDDQTDSNPL